MAKKLIIHVDTEEKKLKLPAIPLRILPSLASLALRLTSSKHGDGANEKVSREDMRVFLKALASELKSHEPFVLVQVETPSEKVLIEVK